VSDSEVSAARHAAETTQGCYSGLLLRAVTQPVICELYSQKEPRAVTQGCYSLQKNPGLLLRAVTQPVIWELYSQKEPRAVTQGCYSASDLGTVPPD